MDKNWQVVKNNIRDIYKVQSKKVGNRWEWNCIWSYLDRLIKIQVEGDNQLKAIKYNNELFVLYFEKGGEKWVKVNLVKD